MIARQTRLEEPSGSPSFRRQRRLAVVTFIALAFLSCESAPTAVAPPPNDDSALVFEVMPTMEQDLAVMDAVNVAVEACMHDSGYEGFDYPPTSPAAYLQAIGTGVPIAATHAYTTMDRSLEGLRDVAIATEEAAPTAPEEPLDSQGMTSPQSDAYWIALSGPTGNHGGCIGRGIAVTYGSVERYDARRTVIGLLPHDIADQAVRNSDTKKALMVWRVCMSELGYEFSDPGEALLAFHLDISTWTEVVHSDTACKRSSHLAAWFAAAWLELAREHSVDESQLRTAAEITRSVAKDDG